jgi:Xaa-Pro aminopeptidase
MVHVAQEFAISAAREGIAARVVDEHARFALRPARLDQYFTHRLGHGKVGISRLRNF